MSLIAKKTVQRARFFAGQAMKVVNEREKFAHYFESSIVFARSVTFHLQKELCHCEGFQEWYEEEQSKLKQQPICRFFLNKRNYILKQGPVKISKTIEASISNSISVHSVVKIKIIRAKPWYHQSIKTLIKNAFLRIRQEYFNWDKRRKRRRQNRKTTESKAEFTERLHFSDEEWKDQSVYDLIFEYCDILEDLVDRAESKFT